MPPLAEHPIYKGREITIETTITSQTEVHKTTGARFLCQQKLKALFTLKMSF